MSKLVAKCESLGDVIFTIWFFNVLIGYCWNDLERGCSGFSCLCTNTWKGQCTVYLLLIHLSARTFVHVMQLLACAHLRMMILYIIYHVWWAFWDLLWFSHSFSEMYFFIPLYHSNSHLNCYFYSCLRSDTTIYYRTRVHYVFCCLALTLALFLV